MPPFYRGEKLRAQGHTGHLTSASSAFNPHAAFAFSSASTPFREGLGFFFFFLSKLFPPLRGGPWRSATHSVSSRSDPLPSTRPRFPEAPRHSTSCRANSNFPSVPRAGRVRYEEPRASRGLRRGDGGGGGEGGARSPQPRRVWAANARPRGARAAASGRRPRVRAGCGAARQETASHGARGRPGRRRAEAWGGRGVAFLPMPGAT